VAAAAVGPAVAAARRLAATWRGRLLALACRSWRVLLWGACQAASGCVPVAECAPQGAAACSMACGCPLGAWPGTHAHTRTHAHAHARTQTQLGVCIALAGAAHRNRCAPNGLCRPSRRRCVWRGTRRTESATCWLARHVGRSSCCSRWPTVPGC
jgi:hypothetical protein